MSVERDVAPVDVAAQSPLRGPADVVLALLDAYSRGDEAAVLTRLHPEIEFVPMLVATGARRTPYRGHDGFMEYLRDSRKVLLDVQITVRAVHENGDLVVVLAQVSGSAAGGPLDTQVTYVFRVQDGLVVHGVVGSDPDNARRAMALDDAPPSLQDDGASAPPLTPLRLELTADPSSVPAIRRAIDAFAGAAGASQQLREDVRLAVSEACSNAVLHAYADRAPGEHGHVTVTASQQGRFLHLDIEDDGRGMAARPDSPGIGVGLVVISRLATVCTITTQPSRHAGSMLHLEFALDK